MRKYIKMSTNGRAIWITAEIPARRYIFDERIKITQKEILEELFLMGYRNLACLTNSYVSNIASGPLYGVWVFVDLAYVEPKIIPKVKLDTQKQRKKKTED